MLYIIGKQRLAHRTNPVSNEDFSFTGKESLPSLEVTIPLETPGLVPDPDFIKGHNLTYKLAGFYIGERINVCDAASANGDLILQKILEPLCAYSKIDGAPDVFEEKLRSAYTEESYSEMVKSLTNDALRNEIVASFVGNWVSPRLIIRHGDYWIGFCWRSDGLKREKTLAAFKIVWTGVEFKLSIEGAHTDPLVQNIMSGAIAVGFDRMFDP
jgi:hypothetical protein